KWPVVAAEGASARCLLPTSYKANARTRKRSLGQGCQPFLEARGTVRTKGQGWTMGRSPQHEVGLLCCGHGIEHLACTDPAVRVELTDAFPAGRIVEGFAHGHR